MQVLSFVKHKCWLVKASFPLYVKAKPMSIGSSEVMHHSKGLLNKMNAMHERVCNVFAICQQRSDKLCLFLFCGIFIFVSTVHFCHLWAVEKLIDSINSIILNLGIEWCHDEHPSLGWHKCSGYFYHLDFVISLKKSNPVSAAKGKVLCICWMLERTLLTFLKKKY